MIKQHVVRLAVVAALGAFAGGAHAISFTAGDWTLDINGTVNAFYVTGEQEATTGSTTVTTDQTNIQNGLLPGWINFVATTKQKGWDVKAHFGFAPGINSESRIAGLPEGLARAYSQIDSRNVYFQFGKPEVGTFKFGRDIGLFFQNPILADMTLLGVGGTVRAAEPFNTSFGMIGHGYMYVAFQPQITYSRNIKLAAVGVDLAAGLFNPSQFSAVSGPQPTERKDPQFQALGSVNWSGPFAGKAWLSTMYNKAENPTNKAEGFEGGVKMNLGNPNLEAVLSAFTGKGIGISTIGAQFLTSDDATGGRLKSEGQFAQLTFKPVPDLKLGVSYGENTDKQLVGVGVDSKRKAYALGAYFSFLPSITLVGEYINEKSTNDFSGANTVKANSVSLGAIIFF